MTRGNFLKSLMMLAVSPKVLSEINITSTRQAVIGNKGILAMVEEKGNIIEYTTANYSLDDFRNLIKILEH